MRQEQNSATTPRPGRRAAADRPSDRHQQALVPVHTLDAYASAATGALPVTETATATATAQQLSLPCYPAMTDDDTQRVITALHALWGR